MSIQSTAGLTRVEHRGELGILNVGHGDTKLTFDPEKPAERERAAAVVKDMLARGYAILVQVGEQDGKPLYMRAEGFDEKTCEYLIVGLPEPIAAAPEIPAMQLKEPKRRGRPRKTRLPAESTRATAVARSAGG